MVTFVGVQIDLRSERALALIAFVRFCCCVHVFYMTFQQVFVFEGGITDVAFGCCCWFNFRQVSWVVLVCIITVGFSFCALRYVRLDATFTERVGFVQIL